MSVDNERLTTKRDASNSEDLATVLSNVLGGLDHTVQIWLEPDLGKIEFEVDRLAASGTHVVVIGSEFAIEESMTIAANFDERHPAVSTVLVARRSPELLERALRVGVAGLIDPLAADAEIREVIVDARDRSRRRIEHQGGPGGPPINRVIPVLAAKGGAGKTTVAVNLAVALSELHPEEVVIVDADVQFGDVTTNLGIEPLETIIDTLQYGSEIDLTTLKAFLTPACDGRLFVLAAPNSPAQADDLSAGHIGTVLRLLRQEFRFVIVDTSAGIDEATLEALDAATDLVVLASMDVPSVRAAAKELDALRLLGMERLDWHLVLNRANSKVGLSQHDIEATLGRPFDAVIPSARAVPMSVNQGEPIVASDP